ncbi:uncharacterized protein LOC126810220 [Patella vulgata]|uniref:uncharacterized protein LOC126810220 n=1 Tax=Patella vulgata TaxID=6465 RepID=UPI0021806CA1|nr:uncharacterized protein LOC126810220 [Patella vulgata]
MALRLLDRPLGYKVGFGLLILSILLVLIGYSIPRWHNYTHNYNDGYNNDKEKESTTYISGLWGRCKSDYTNCEYWVDVSGFLYGVRVMNSFGIIFIGISVGLAFWLNFSGRANRHEIDNISVEIVAGIGGIFGIICIIVYAVNVKNESSTNHIDAAFAVSCVGYLITLTAAGLIAISHGKKDNPKTTNPWPYGLGSGLVDAGSRETQIDQFPVDNPAFVDPTQIRFTRTTRPPSSSDNLAFVAPPYSLQPNSNPPGPYYPAQPVPPERKKHNVHDAANTSYGQMSEDEAQPPSYDSIMSLDSSASDVRNVHMDPNPQQRSYARFPRMVTNNEVEL